MDIADPKVGDTIEATVTAVKGYGIFLQYRHDQIVVLAPEVLKCLGPNGMDSIAPGTSQRITILRKNEQTGQFVGTIARSFGGAG